jgi:hypothetical protein
MSVAEQFYAAWTEVAAADSDGPELLPVRLARACVQVLPVAGAGISVMDTLRVPVGASDPLASVAESLESTAGEGPCLVAHASRRPVVATETSIRQIWPAFYAELTARTPYRSVASVPLAVGAQRLGAIDFYFECSEDAAELRLAEACVVADEVSAAMGHAPAVMTDFGIPAPSWLSAASAQARLRVWQAIGRVSVALLLDVPDALSLIRAHAYTAGRDLDDVAADLVSGELPTDALRL